MVDRTIKDADMYDASKENKPKEKVGDLRQGDSRGDEGSRG